MPKKDTTENYVPDEDPVVEARVREMLEPESGKAPESGQNDSKKPRETNVTHRQDDETTAAIEEANRQLRATAPELSEPLKIEVLPADSADDAPLPVDADESVTDEPVAEEVVADMSEETESPAEQTDEISQESVGPDDENKEESAVPADGVLFLGADEPEQVTAPKAPVAKVKLRTRIANLWRKHPIARKVWIILLLLAVAAAGTVPTSRYYVLNTAGVRSSTSLIVMDQSTQKPLKSVQVSIGSQTATTDLEGRAVVNNVKLGPSEMTISKRGFATLKKWHTFGWGSNPLGDLAITPTGSQYVIQVNDFVSGKPVENVEAASGDASALSNDKGEIKLTIDESNENDLEVTLKADGYREEKIKIGINETSGKAVQLVVNRKHAFVTNRAGKLDVYKVDIDGTREERILAGTGTERDDMVVVPHPTDEVVAVVSSRENKRNKDGFLLSTLTIIGLKNNETKAITSSERVQVVDWIGPRLIYVRVAEGTSASSPNRHRLMSYEYNTGENKELVASNFFNDVMIVSGKIYYAPSNAYQSSPEVGLFRLDGDGSNKQTITPKETWNLLRMSYDRITVAMPQAWYEYRLGDKSLAKLDGPPAKQETRIYTDSPDGKNSLWVDIRDGKGVLLRYDTATKTDVVVRTQGGLKNPIRWLDNKTFIYRIKTESLTADYVTSLDGGEPKLVRDVSDTGGVDQWYYY